VTNYSLVDEEAIAMTASAIVNTEFTIKAKRAQSCFFVLYALWAGVANVSLWFLPSSV
jgi:hypothetical protein